MGKYRIIRAAAVLSILLLPFIFVEPAFAADGDVVKVENFIKAVTGVVAKIAGSIALLIVVIGGVMYAISTGNPERMDTAKTTMKSAGIGLAIVIGAALLINIVTDLATSNLGN